MSSQFSYQRYTERKAVKLADVLAPAPLAQVQEALRQNPFRRLSNQPEVEVRNEHLCQSVHIDHLEGAPQRVLGGKKSQYYLHSMTSAKQELETLLSLGIKSAYLQLQPFRKKMESRAIIDQFAENLHEIKQTFGQDLFLVADPQGLCMGEDLRWGVRSPAGVIDAEVTLDVLAEAAGSFAEAGMDALVTIGRVNCETAVARAALDKSGKPIELWAFSTNSETPNAYFDITAHDVSKAQTNQKILVGNNLEMFLRSLNDIAEGVDVVVQKPVENMQILLGLRWMLESRLPVETILGEERTAGLMDSNPWLFKDGIFDVKKLKAKFANVKLGTYEVSGTYSIYKHIEDQYSDALAVAMLDEMYRNALGAAGSRIRSLIGRNMLWFAQARRDLGL